MARWLTRDRVIGGTVVGGALLAIWAYAEFSPYQRCLREQMAELIDVPVEWRSQTAEKVCEALTQ